MTFRLLFIMLLVIGCEKKVAESDTGEEEVLGCLIEEQFASIQDQIDAASDGDTVLIQPGTYTGNINFKGKNIVVGSLYLTTGDASYIQQTIIDANKNGSVVKFENDEGPEAVLAGVTLTNGSAYQGGGIYVNGASPTLRDLVITGNQVLSCTEGPLTVTAAGGGIYLSNSEAILNNVSLNGNKSEISGGGIFCQTSSPSFRNITVAEDTASDGGGIYLMASNPEMVRMWLTNNVGDRGAGIFFSLSNPTLENVIVAQNVAAHDGGGLYLINSGPDLVNVVVADNEATSGGGAFLSGASPDIMNSMIWGNSPEGVYFQGSGTASSVSFSYSDVEGGISDVQTNDNGTATWGAGNIVEEPAWAGDGCVCDDSCQTGYNLERPGGIPIEGSPGYDDGSPQSRYNDLPDATGPGDTETNDMGFTGGPNGDCGSGTCTACEG